MRVPVGIGTVASLAAVVAAYAPAPRAASSPAQSTATSETTARIVSSAQAFLGTLDETGRAKAQFPFDSPQKSRWSNFPTGIFARAGVRLGDLTPAQRTAAMTLLSTALSQSGYQKVVGIMRADQAFRGLAAGQPPPGGGGGGGGAGREPGGPGGGGAKFGEDEYYLAFVGTPSATAPWMLQFGGHHLAINLTLAGARATLAPSHTGVQPASYTFEGRTIRPLGSENDKAFALMAALDASQRGQAVLGYRVSDLVLGPGQDGRTIQPEGVRASALSSAQQTLLLDIVREWAGISNEAFATPRMEEIRANLPQTYFAWSGPTTAGSAAYFRIQGPTLVIEYAPQRGVDHVHTIYRDPTNDYGSTYARP